MAEIRCPMCGKPNPDNLEICQFCEARIKPLRAADSPEDRPSPENRHLGLPDWLLDDSPNEPESEEIASREETEDWLERLKPRSADQGSSEEPRDWLEGLREDSEDSLFTQMEAETSDDEDQTAMEGSDDWLSRIRALHKADREFEELDPPQELIPEYDLPQEGVTEKDREELGDRGSLDWLSQLDVIEEQQVEEHDVDGSMPDWLAESLSPQLTDDEIVEPETSTKKDPFDGKEQPGIDTSPPKDDFLEAEDRIFTGAEPETDELETLAWLTRLEKGEPEEEAIEEPLPDWLRESLQSQPAQSVPLQPETPEFEDSGDIMEETGLEATAPEPLFQETEEELITGAESERVELESLDWSTRLEVGEPEEKAAEEPLPGWLQESHEPQEPFSKQQEIATAEDIGISDFPESVVDESPKPDIADRELREVVSEDEHASLDWLRQLDDIQPESEKETEEEPMPDWLKESLGFSSDLRDTHELAAAVDSSTKITSDQVDQEATGVDEVIPEEEPFEADDTEARAWLDRLEKQAKDEDDKTSEEPVPDWLGADEKIQSSELEDKIDQEAVQPDIKAPDEDVAVSLRASLGAAELEAFLDEPDESFEDDDAYEADETETASWLGRLRGEELETTTEKTGEKPIPEWLRESLKPEDEKPDLVEEIREDDLPEDKEIPETINLIETSEKVFGTDQVMISEDDTVPEWLTEGGEIITPAVEPLAGTDMTEHLSGEVVEAEITHDDESPSDEIVDVLQGKEPLPADEEYLQQWFSDLDLESTSDEQPGEVEDVREEMPSWLKSLGSVVTGTVEDDPNELDNGAITPFITEKDFGDDMLDVDKLPEWLTPESAPAEGVEAEPKTNLPEAEVPGWLAAIRPTGKKATDRSGDDAKTEGIGPLAGLNNILPAEPEIVQFETPPSYSGKLMITPTQQAHAEIFKELLSLEGKTEKIPEPPLITSQRALRWLIASIMTAAVVLMVALGSQGAPLPNHNTIPDTTYASSRVINNLAAQAPVLIAFDYDPGTTGEMHAAAAGVVNHLMLKEARLALVSTLPTGPMVAANFVNSFQQHFGYPDIDQYINLGYIAGGPAGLQSFVSTPKLVFPRSFGGIDPWNTQILQGVNVLPDFALLIVITNNSNTARSWIEQVQPSAGDTPLLTIVSAQAEPMIRPYFGSEAASQVQGIVSGLPGGAAYEAVIGKNNLGRQYWDSFGIGLIMAASAIIIGGIYNLVLMFRDQGITFGKRGRK